ncbi:Rv2993c-like domain-containing protein [Streptomyces sp. M19]
MKFVRYADGPSTRVGVVNGDVVRVVDGLADLLPLIEAGRPSCSRPDGPRCGAARPCRCRTSFRSRRSRRLRPSATSTPSNSTSGQGATGGP